MELISGLLTLATSQAIRAIVRSSEPHAAPEVAGTAAGLAEKLLSAVLVSQDESKQAFDQLTGKIDDLTRSQYRDRMETGYRLLREAMATEQDAVKRSGRIEAAQNEFVAAAARAKHAEAPGVALLEAEVLVATCWLANGSLREFQRVLARTAHEALLEIDRLNNGISAPTLRGVYDYWEAQLVGKRAALARRRLADPSGSELQEARDDLYRVKAAPRDALVFALNEVQALRRAYGVDPADCARLAGFYYGRSFYNTGRMPDTPYSRTDVARESWCLVFEQPARFEAFAVHFEQADVRLRYPARGFFGRSWLVDATLLIEARCQVDAPDRVLDPLAEQENFGTTSSKTPLLPSQAGLALWNGQESTDFHAPTRIALRTWASTGNYIMLRFRPVEQLAATSDRRTVYVVRTFT